MSNSNGSSNHSSTPEITTIDLTEEQAQRLAGGPNVTVQQREVRSFNSSDLVPARGGILATAREANGDPAYKLHPRTIVTYRGVPMPLEFAERRGLVRRNPQTGDYEDTTAGRELQEGVERAVEEQQRIDETQFPVQISEEGRGFLNDLHAALKAIGANPREAALEFLRDPTSAAAKYGPQLAKLSGSSEDEIGEDLVETMREVKGQVAALVQAEGVDPQEFGAFMKANRHSAHAAILDSLDGDASTMKRLIARFKSERPNRRRATPEGLKTRKTRDGTEYIRVKLPNGREIEVSVANARMQGWID